MPNLLRVSELLGLHAALWHNTTAKEVRSAAAAGAFLNGVARMALCPYLKMLELHILTFQVLWSLAGSLLALSLTLQSSRVTSGVDSYLVPSDSKEYKSATCLGESSLQKCETG